MGVRRKDAFDRGLMEDWIGDLVGRSVICSLDGGVNGRSVVWGLDGSLGERGAWMQISRRRGLGRVDGGFDVGC